MHEIENMRPNGANDVVSTRLDFVNNNSKRLYSEQSVMTSKVSSSVENPSELKVVEDELNEDEDQLWFDPWEGQIELSSHELSAADLSLDDELLLDEFRILSSSPVTARNSLEQRRKSILLQRKETGLTTCSTGLFDNFHSAHTLFWNNHQFEPRLEEDVSCC